MVPSTNCRGPVCWRCPGHFVVKRFPNGSKIFKNVTGCTQNYSKCIKMLWKCFILSQECTQNVPKWRPNIWKCNKLHAKSFKMHTNASKMIHNVSNCTQHYKHVSKWPQSISKCRMIPARGPKTKFFAILQDLQPAISISIWLSIRAFEDLTHTMYQICELIHDKRRSALL